MFRTNRQPSSVTSLTKHWVIQRRVEVDPGVAESATERCPRSNHHSPDSSTQPTLYLFEQGDRAHVRDSGAPEMTTRFCISLEPGPEWLGDEQVWGTFERRETKDGLTLICNHSSAWYVFFSF